VIRDKADVKIIAVEFDEVFHHKKGIGHLIRIRDCCRKLEEAGYIMVHSTSRFKRTFIRKDVFTELKDKEKFSSQN
jgi:hypothetical protein